MKTRIQKEGKWSKVTCEDCMKDEVYRVKDLDPDTERLHNINGRSIAFGMIIGSIFTALGTLILCGIGA